MKKPKKIHINREILNDVENNLIIRDYRSPQGVIKIKATKDSSEIELKNWELYVLGEEFFQFENFKYPYTSFKYEDKKRDSLKRPKKTDLTHGSLGSIYNGMLHPIIPFTIKGIIWYQGESNIEPRDKNLKNTQN